MSRAAGHVLSLLLDAFPCSVAVLRQNIFLQRGALWFPSRLFGPGNLPSNWNPVAHKLQTSGDVQPSCCCVIAFSRGVGASSSGCICLLCIQEALSSTASRNPEGRWSWSISHLCATTRIIWCFPFGQWMLLTWSSTSLGEELQLGLTEAVMKLQVCGLCWFFNEFQGAVLRLDNFLADSWSLWPWVVSGSWRFTIGEGELNGECTEGISPEEQSCVLLGRAGSCLIIRYFWAWISLLKFL